MVWWFGKTAHSQKVLWWDWSILRAVQLIKKLAEGCREIVSEGILIFCVQVVGLIQVSDGAGCKGE